MKVYSYMKRPPSVGMKDFEPSRTQQQFKQEADINWIVKRFADTGFVNPMDTRPRRQPIFGDFSNLGSFQEQQDNVNAVVDYFATLPSEVRAQFFNNPSAFAKFASDPANIPALQKLGLLPVQEVIKDDPKPSDPQVDPVEDPRPEG